MELLLLNSIFQCWCRTCNLEIQYTELIGIQFRHPTIRFVKHGRLSICTVTFVAIFTVSTCGDIQENHCKISYKDRWTHFSALQFKHLLLEFQGNKSSTFDSLWDRGALRVYAEGIQLILKPLVSWVFWHFLPPTHSTILPWISLTFLFPSY